VPKVILFREEHSPRTLVERVDFVSAPGVSPPGVFRPGGPHALVTGRAVFAFDRTAARFRLVRGEIAPKVLSFYPEFAGRVWGLAA
jgi:glutaconate CoA-transferase subunit B